MAARQFGVPGLPLVITVGAVTAMVGVLLNLNPKNKSLMCTLRSRTSLTHP